jgi:hypothetical protein
VKRAVDYKGECVLTMEGHEGPVHCVAVNCFPLPHPALSNQPPEHTLGGGEVC